jgi:hypothetical protein
MVINNMVRFQVLTASNVKTVSWGVAHCSLVEVYRRLRYLLLLIIRAMIVITHVMM